MASAVDAAIADGRHLIVQAGTGTGKTLGYLVPAMLTGKRIVVATATKALQDQLAAKDLPFLEAHLGTPFDWAVLKGRSNYICMQRVRELQSEAARSVGDRGLRGEHEGRDPAIVRVVGHDPDRRSGRPRLVADRPILAGGERRQRRVPGRHEVPDGRRVLRRTGPRPGGGRRCRRRQPAPLRPQRRQRQHAAARTRRRRDRRGPPTRRHHERHRRCADRARPVHQSGGGRAAGDRRSDHRRRFGRSCSGDS